MARNIGYKYGLIILGILFSIQGCLNSPKEIAARGDRYYKEGRNLSKNKKFEASEKQFKNALENYNKLSELNPSCFSFVQAGNIHYWLNDKDKSISSYKSAIDIDSKCYKALNNSAFLWYKETRKNIFNIMNSQEFANSSIFQVKTLFSANASNFQQSIQLYNDALKVHPENPMIYNNLAILYISSMNFSRAKIALDKALSLSNSTEVSSYSKQKIIDNINTYKRLSSQIISDERNSREIYNECIRKGRQIVLLGLPAPDCSGIEFNDLKQQIKAVYSSKLRGHIFRGDLQADF